MRYQDHGILSMVFLVWVTFTEYKSVFSLKVYFLFTARHHRISLDNFAKMVYGINCECHLPILCMASPVKLNITD